MNTGNNSQAALRAIVERIERLEEEKEKIGADIKEVYQEAKAVGFDAKILRKFVSLRKKEKKERDEEQSMIETYMAALGDLADTPLGQAAIKAEFE